MSSTILWSTEPFLKIMKKNFFNNTKIIDIKKLKLIQEMTTNICYIGDENLSIDFNDKTIISGNVLDLYSNDYKIIFTPNASLYHFVTDVFIVVAFLYKNIQNLHIVIDITDAKKQEFTWPTTKIMLDFLIKCFDYYKIKYTLLNFEGFDYIKINNYQMSRVVPNALIYSELLFDFIKPFIKKHDQKPNKKIYLSRKKIPISNRDYSKDEAHQTILQEIKENGLTFPHFNDDRIYNEDVLEKFFIKNKFDVCYPEDFESFEDQINFMYSVKTLVSLTSSGITNALFMQNKGNIVEIVTPLILGNTKIDDNGNNKVISLQNELHHFYSAISYVKHHNYFGIQNHTRLAEDVVNNITKNNIIGMISKNE